MREPKKVERFRPTHPFFASDEISNAKSRYDTNFKTLKELRQRNYSSVDPLDRFDKALNRCLKRRSEDDIVLVLKKEVPIMIQLGASYVVPKGPYRRLLASFAKLPHRIMATLLMGL